MLEKTQLDKTLMKLHLHFSTFKTFSEISCIHDENHNIINKSSIYKSQISFHEIYCFGFFQDEISFENKNRQKKYQYYDLF